MIALLYNAFRKDSCSSVRQAAVPIAIVTVDVAIATVDVAIATVDVAWPHLRCTQWMTASNSSRWWKVNASPGRTRARMTVVTSPQGRQRIVVHETKVIWFFTNYQFFEHFGLLHKTTKCGGWSLFSCAVTNYKYFMKKKPYGKCPGHVSISQVVMEYSCQSGTDHSKNESIDCLSVLYVSINSILH